MNDPRYTEAEHLAALRAGVSKTAREHFSDRERLVPILAPASLLGEGTWVGPFEPLAAPGLVLVWATLGPHDTMVYLSHGSAAVFAEEGVDFRALGLENLRRLSSEKWTYEFKRESGEIWGVGVMQTDACGPSRLLLADVWKRSFRLGIGWRRPNAAARWSSASTSIPLSRAKSPRSSLRATKAAPGRWRARPSSNGS